ncbi:MAG: hypothetical protein ACFB20_02305 [Opitutales bacterium]
MVALLLLGLLLTLAMAATTLIRTETEAARLQQSDTLARQYARFAFERALLEVQAATGPDQRITAPGTVYFEDGHPASNWVGVWDTSNWDPAEPEKRTFLGWLASGQTRGSGEAPGEAARLSGPMAQFSEGQKVLRAPYETVRLQRPPGLGNAAQARVAWCVRDESQKIRIDLMDTTTDRVPASFDLSALISADATVSGDQLTSILQPSQADFIEALGPEVSNHWITASSLGLLCDVRRGGLRQALLPILYDGRDPGFPLLSKPEGAPEVPLPGWDTLRSQLSGHLDASGEAVEPRGWGEIWRPGDTVWDNPESVSGDETVGFGPVLLRATVSLDVTRDANADLLLGWQVSLMLWNPYDAPLVEHAYSVRLQDAPEALPSRLRLTFTQSDGQLPELTVHVALSETDPANPLPFFTAQVTAAFLPGQVRVFSTRTQLIEEGAPRTFELEAGDAADAAVWQPIAREELPGGAAGAFELQLSRAKGWNTIEVFEADWRDLEWVLYDADQRVIQLAAGLAHTPWVSAEGELIVPPSVSTQTRTFDALPLALKGFNPLGEPEPPRFNTWMSAYFVRKCALPASSDPTHEAGPWLALHEPAAALSAPGRFQYYSLGPQGGEPGVRPGNWAWRGEWMQPADSEDFQREAFFRIDEGNLWAAAMGTDFALYPVFRDAADWYSLGQLRHLRLNLPSGPPQRFGRSQAHLRIETSDTWSVASPRFASWHDRPEQERLLDAQWLLNDRLWDSLYCFGEVSADETGRWHAAATSRLVPVASPGANVPDNPAALLALQGPMNVNCTDADVWFSLLASGRTHGGGDAVSFGRGLRSPVSPEPLWAESLTLDLEDDLRPLAAALAEEVRARGPFVGLGDFVNRRLVQASAPNADHGLHGVLEAALQRTQGDGPQAAPLERGLPWFLDAHVSTDDNTGLPGYARQQDLLEKLGPLLTTRGDTFTIHACAEVLNPLTGAVEARAHCRGVVQRVPAWIDAADAPTHALGELLAVNRQVGRRYVVREFAWVD